MGCVWCVCVSSVTVCLNEVVCVLVESKTMETAADSSLQVLSLSLDTSRSNMETLITGALESASMAKDLRNRLVRSIWQRHGCVCGTSTIGTPTLPEIQADIKASMQAYSTAKKRLDILMDRAHVASKALGDAVENVTNLSGALNTHVDLLRDSAKAVRAARAYVHYVALCHDHVCEVCVSVCVKMGKKQQGEELCVCVLCVFRVKVCVSKPT